MASGSRYLAYSVGAVVLILVALAPWVLPNYYLHTLTTAGIFIMLASGLNLIHGFIGRLSLGHTAFYGLGAYTAALLATTAGWGLLMTLPAAALVASLLALGIGHITLRFRGAQFVLVTLAVAAIAHLFATNLVDITGGPMGIAGIQTPLVHSSWGNWVIFGSKASFYWLVLAFDIFTIYLIWRIVRSPLGDAMIAVREDENIAESIGVNEYRYSMIAFVVGAALAGSGGAIYAHYVSFISPEVFSFNIMIMILVMVILGGVGTVGGPIIGSLVVVVLLEVLRLHEALREPIFGIVLIVATLLFPKGIAYVAERLSQRWNRTPQRRHAADGSASSSSEQAEIVQLAGRNNSRNGEVLLRVQGLGVQFGGLVAVDDVSFEVKRGQIVSLIGPNGAGKTTTLNLLTGFVARGTGQIVFDGQELPGRVPANRIARIGIIRTFQVTRGLLGVTIGKAVETGLHRTLGLTWGRIVCAMLWGLPDMALERRAAGYLREVGLTRPFDELTSNLSYGEQRLLEVAIALAARPRLLVLDEPVAGMNPEETSRMMSLIRRLRDGGTTILLVEHDMKFVMGLSDHIVVLDHGKRIAEGTALDIQANPAVIEAYLGRGVGHAAA